MATITLALDSPVCSEGNGSVDVCAVISGLPAGGLGVDIAIDLNFTGDSAGLLCCTQVISTYLHFIFLVMGEDFSVASSVTVVFSSSGDIMNGDTVCVTVDILDDDIYEKNQDFFVKITAIAPPSAAVAGIPDIITKTIQDNGGWCVKFLKSLVFLCTTTIFRCCRWFCDG